MAVSSLYLDFGQLEVLSKRRRWKMEWLEVVLTTYVHPCSLSCFV